MSSDVTDAPPAGSPEGPKNDDRILGDLDFDPPKWHRRLLGVVTRNTFSIAVGALLVFLVGGPLLFLLRMSLAEPGSRPSNPQGYSLANYKGVLENDATMEAARNTAIYAVGVTIVSLTLAVLAAWLIERTNMRFRNFAWVVMLAPLAVPKMLSSMAYILLLAPRSGAINVAIRDFLGLFGVDMDQGPINIYSMGGMIFVEGTRGVTALFLMIVGAFRLMDPALEEAAVMSGARRGETLRRVTLPLMAPVLLGALIYGLVGNVQDFDTPLFLGLPAGIFVIPTLIYFSAYSTPVPNWGVASAYAYVFLVFTLLLSAVYYRKVIRRSKRYTTVSGKGFRPSRLPLGRWRNVATAGFMIYALVVIGLPVLMLLWTSLMPVYQPPSISGLQDITFSNYAYLFSSNTLEAFKNSVTISLLASVTTVSFAFAVSWAVIRMQVRGRAVFDSLAFIPNVIPSVALGLAFVVFFLSPAGRWTGIYGSLGLLIVAFTVHYLAYASRITNGALLQMSTELDEAGWAAGVGKVRTLFGVTLPVLMSTFVAGAVWVFAMTFKNLSLPLLLGTPGTQTISMEIYQLWTINGEREKASALGITMVAILVLTAYLARKVVARGFTAE